MPTRDSKNRPPIGIKPEESVYDEIEVLCRRHDRVRAYIALKLMLRGLAAYRKDGQLNEPALTDSGETDEELRRKGMMRVKEDPPADPKPARRRRRG